MLSEYRQTWWAVDQATLGAVHRALTSGQLVDSARDRALGVFGGSLPAPEHIRAAAGDDSIGSTDAQLAAALESASRSRELCVTGGVAVIPLRGLITPRPSLLSILFGGGAGLQGFRAELREALGNDAVSSIVLDIDSPGGRVDLVPETAAEILAARAQKPITAVANTMAASAAYWIASAAGEIVVTPSGDVGSVGVWRLHNDWSAWNERFGVDPTYIHAGRYKVEGNSDEPLSDEAREAWQQDVDEINAAFIAAIAKGRGVKPSVVRSDFGEGRMLMAKRAVAAGMADRVATLEETIARLVGTGKRAAPTPTPSEVRELPMSDGQRETREVEIAGVEVRSNDDGGLTLSGYAAVFDSVSEDLGGFTEVIQRGAFRKVLRTKPDVRFLVNHVGIPLARTKSGTLRLAESPKGLKFEADLPDTQQARDLATSVERRDIDQMSFRFRVQSEGRDWHFPDASASELPRRSVHEVEQLYDVSIVTFPGYSETVAELRGEICGLPVKDADGDLDETLVREACDRIHAGDVDASPDDRRELERAADLAGVVAPWRNADVGEGAEQEEYGLAVRERRLRALERDGTVER